MSKNKLIFKKKLAKAFAQDNIGISVQIVASPQGNTSLNIGEPKRFEDNREGCSLIREMLLANNDRSGFARICAKVALVGSL